MLKLVTAITICTLPILNAQETKQMPTTAEQQKAITPDQVLSGLMEGNKRYVSGQLTDLNIKESIKATSKSQYPSAVILSCLDSRVPVESVFDQGIGDIFVGRVAGNVADTDMLGSFEFATKLAGSKLVMVLGHEACGAVKGACDGAKLGNLTSLLEKIQPAVDQVKGEFAEEKQNSKNLDFVNKAVESNVRLTVADIRKKSPVLAQMEADGEIKIVGAIYSLHTGEVTLVK